MREDSALGRSADFQTGLERVGGLVDRLQPEPTLSRFGNRRSAKESRIRRALPDSTTGVRPSSGAAASDPPSTLENFMP